MHFSLDQQHQQTGTVTGESTCRLLYVALNRDVLNTRALSVWAVFNPAH